jgi:hypothetical protein
MNFKDQKSWKSIIAYSIPVIIVVLANLFHITITDEIKNKAIELADMIVTVIFGIIGLIGVWKSHDKKK